MELVLQYLKIQLKNPEKRENIKNGILRDTTPRGGTGNARLISARNHRFEEYLTIDEARRAAGIRPLPTDSSLLPGYHWEGGIIAPDQEESHDSYTAVYSNTHVETENYADKFLQQEINHANKKIMRANYLTITFIVGILITNIFAAIFTDLSWPIGFIFLPFLIWSLSYKRKWERVYSKYDGFKKKRETDELLRKINGPDTEEIEM